MRANNLLQFERFVRMDRVTVKPNPDKGKSAKEDSPIKVRNDKDEKVP
jgi:hypothetical protein